MVLHLLNHERLLGVRLRVLGPVVRDTAEGETFVFLRLLEYDPADAPERIWVEFVTAARDGRVADADDPGPGWSITAHRAPHTAMPFPVLRAIFTLTPSF